MNPDHAKTLKDHIEALAAPGKVPDSKSAPTKNSDILTTVKPMQQQLTALKLSQGAQNAENYRQSVMEASHSLEQLLKVPAHEFDYSQFFQTADVLLKAGKSSIPVGDKHSRTSILQSGNLELVDTPTRQDFSTGELNQELDSQSIAQFNELHPDVVQPSDNTEAQIAQLVQSDRNLAAQSVDNAKIESPELINDQLQELEITTKPYVDAATSNIMSAQGKIFSESVKTMLDFQGDKHPDGSRTFDSDNYHFRLDGPDGSVSVTALNGGTILAQGKVMQSASETDIEALETINDLAQELVQSKHLAQTQTKVQNQVISL